jgi:hypothetical protein
MLGDPHCTTKHSHYAGNSAAAENRKAPSLKEKAGGSQSQARLIASTWSKAIAYFAL